MYSICIIVFLEKIVDLTESGIGAMNVKESALETITGIEMYETGIEKKNGAGIIVNVRGT